MSRSPNWPHAPPAGDRFTRTHRKERDVPVPAGRDAPPAHLDAKVPEDFDQAPTEATTLKKLGAAISAAGEELQVYGRKMAFAGGHDQR